MNLNELFDSKYEWDGLKSKGDGDYEAWFEDSDGRDVNIMFLNQHRPKQEWFEVEFTRGGDYGMTGSGDAAKIFSTVLDITYEFIDAVDPDIISFSAKSDETSRIKFYNRIIKKIITKGYELEDENEESSMQRFKNYKLVKKT